MWIQILTFELAYRSRRPATYIYFAVMFLTAFLAVTTDAIQIGGSSGLTKQNSPYVLTQMMIIVSAFFAIITSSIMGVAILRDFEHKTESLMFSTPMRKGDYLMGRFLGSYIVAIFVFLGMLLGFLVGEFMPWREADQLQSFNVWAYVHPFLVFVIPNVFVSGALFFAAGALSRRMLVVYTQGMLLFVFYAIALQLASDLDNRQMAALLDPFGVRTFGVTTEYWSAAERNTRFVAMEGILLWNRTLWIAIGMLTLLVTHLGFSFRVVPKSWRKHKAKPTSQQPLLLSVPLPAVHPTTGLPTHIRQIWTLSVFYGKDLFKQVPFWAIVISGMALLLANATNFFEMYGTPIYATSYAVVEMIRNSFTLFFVILTVFYTGELVWKERQVKLHLIFDATPVPDFVPLLSKFLGFMGASMVLLFLLILTGVLIQLLNGYPEIDWSVYIGTLYTETFALILLYSLLGFFVQTVVNQKFIGFAIIILFFILETVMGLWGWEHRMLHFASGSLDTFSEMNRFGHYTTPFSWLTVYWFAVAAVLFGAAVLLSVRGADALFKQRLRLGRLRLRPQLIAFMILAFLTFGVSGGFVFYNTTQLNTYMTSKDLESLQADYEKTLKVYQHLPQPKIVDTRLTVEIFPERRDVHAEGYYILKNKTDQPIQEIHIQRSSDTQTRLEQLTFSRRATIKEDIQRLGYLIYTLEEALEPQDSLQMDFRVVFETKGFQDGASNTGVVYNGTFFNNTTFFPTLGYNPSYELSNDQKRKEKDLPEKERMMSRDDPRGQAQNLFGDDADRIRFEITLGTSLDQVAIAPGYLQREWTENNRRYFHYRMDVPMVNFYSIVSARYVVARDTWQPPTTESTRTTAPVALEIYHHPGHDYNLQRMFKGMKDALTYCATHFSPYQYEQMRIMEFPRYSNFAQSFANTIPFSEGIGFILNIDKSADNVDVSYYVTAHEIAHQWWGHQVTEASTQGNAMLSESLSQYTALMVMKHAYPPEMMQKFLRYELNSYLRGRANETKKEQPLVKVEAQSYIHYRKGSLAMYALQDYIGEQTVNAALRRYVRDWAFREDRYPTSKDLMGYFREVTPDTLQHVLDDLFETITFFELQTKSTQLTTNQDQTYELELQFEAQKYRADSIGNDIPTPIRDWIDVGVYAQSSAGTDSLIYLQKHYFDAPQTRLKLRLPQKPTRAGIDPLHILIDRHPKDNHKAI